MNTFTLDTLNTCKILLYFYLSQIQNAGLFLGTEYFYSYVAAVLK